MKPLRMHRSTFVTARKNAAYFWEVRVDVPNRRVTTLAGRAGTAGRRVTRRFNSYEDVRDFAERVTEQKLSAGYAQVA